MRRANVRFNYLDYLQLPEDKRYEILDGELYVVPAPSTRHQEISIRLSTILFQHVRQQKIGRVLAAPCDVVLSEENVVQPDILFVRKERCSIISEPNIRGAFNIVIEILSSATRAKDLEIKRKLYACFGVQEYWMVDSSRGAQAGVAPTNMTWNQQFSQITASKSVARFDFWPRFYGLS